MSVDTGSKFTAGVVDTADQVPPVSLAPVVHIECMANVYANFYREKIGRALYSIGLLGAPGQKPSIRRTRDKNFVGTSL